MFIHQKLTLKNCCGELVFVTTQYHKFDLKHFKKDVIYSLFKTNAHTTTRHSDNIMGVVKQHNTAKTSDYYSHFYQRHFTSL